MEQEVSNFKSIRAKFQEEILAKSRPMLPEKPKRLPIASFGRSGLITITPSPAQDTKTPGLPRVIFREDQKVASGKRPISFPGFAHKTHEDDGNRHSLKVRHLPHVLPISTEPKHNIAAPSYKMITSPIKCNKKPMPAPFKQSKISLCSKEIGKQGLEHIKSCTSHVHAEEFAVKAVNTEHVEIQQTRVSNPSSQCPSPQHPSTSSPCETLTDSSTSSVTQFFDQHVFSTLEKAKKKLSQKNLLVCGRPKSIPPNKGATSTECSQSPTESESSHPKTVFPARTGCPFNGVPVYASTSPFRVNKISPSAITHIRLNGVTQLEKDHPKVRKTLPDLATLGPSPLKPPRPPHVNLIRCKTHGHSIDSNEKHEREPEILATRNALVEGSTGPPPEFPHFDSFAQEAKEGNAMNIPALELEATEFPETSSLLNEGDSVNFQAPLVQHSPSRDGSQNMWSGEVLTGSLEEKRNVKILSSVAPSEPASADVEANGSHVSNHSSALLSRSTARKPVIMSMRTWSRSQDSLSLKTPGSIKDLQKTRTLIMAMWKEQQSPEHCDEKDQKKKEKQRLEREKKQQKEKQKKRNEMHKRFKITGLEEPMYHARVLVPSKLRKHDLSVKSGDVISIIRTVNCPKGKWLARDVNNKYGYISVMNVELNIKEMLELGKRASHAAGRGQTDGDNVSFSSRSSHQTPMLTISFSDDSEEWTCDEETVSPSAENLSQNRAVSMPDMFYSNLSAHHTVSDGSTEDINTQSEALQKLAVFFQNGHENLITTTEDELPLPKYPFISELISSIFVQFDF
ncbi:hypothetical protein E1301_Tti018437 [Triplophysa tibetana]|uniref:FYN-binding protein 1 n=1 Tax=Triplophysa tibetana TaxID=1572043 RepID=A0A5A9PEY1_9TELE|nr:hypothetical protein E1301_Tti018437 [Triplophysa tibetana]